MLIKRPYCLFQKEKDKFKIKNKIKMYKRNEK